MNDPSCVLYLPLGKKDGSKFMSDDAYGRLATVTGALWRPNGRYFDGVDDTINLGDTLGFEYNSPFTLIIWNTRPAAGSTQYALLSKTLSSGTYRGWLYYYRVSGGVEGGISLILRSNVTGVVALEVHTTNNYTNANQRYMLAVTYNGSGAASGVIHYVDGVAVPMTTESDALASSTILNTQAAQVGSMNASQLWHKEMIDKVWVYNRVFPASEILDRYLVTR